MKLTKSYELASFKALDDSAPGTFEAYVSMFGSVDLQGDRVMPGAFTKSLKEWSDSGDPIPIVWSHSWGDAFAHIGYADPKKAVQTPQGLKLVGQLDVDKPYAKQVYDLLKARRIREWSFAYDVIDEKMAPDKANNLVELGIIEAGPTLKGANENTDTLSVKADLETATRKGATASGVQTAHDSLVAAGAHCQPTQPAPTVNISNGTKSYGEVEPIDGSYEGVQDELRSALVEDEGGSSAVDVCVVGTFPDHVVYTVRPKDNNGFTDYAGDASSYSRTYSYDDATDAITFGDRVDVDLATEVTPAAKTESRTRTKAVDNTAWDGSAALKAAGKSDDPASAFGAICAGKRSGPAVEAGSWALPHHKNPGDPPNAKGVEAALGSLSGARGQTVQGLTNEADARKHLEDHEAAIQASAGESKSEIDEYNRKLALFTAEL